MQEAHHPKPMGSKALQWWNVWTLSGFAQPYPGVNFGIFLYPSVCLVRAVRCNQTFDRTGAGLTCRTRPERRVLAREAGTPLIREISKFEVPRALLGTPGWGNLSLEGRRPSI